MKKCNFCGRELNEFDVRSGFSLHTKAGYGSVYDGDDIHIDMCCSCFDTLMPVIEMCCKVSPITYNDQYESGGDTSEKQQTD